MSEQSFGKLVEEFAACVMAQDKAIEQGDAHTGNKFARRYIAAFETLRAHGGPGREALAVLLDHRSPNVRVTAAAFLLRHCEFKARRALKAEAKERVSPPSAQNRRSSIGRMARGLWILNKCGRDPLHSALR
jgi:hypothetical protein